MSGKISGLVWDLALEKTEKWVLLAMTDHADHQGRNMHPAIGLIAWKTELSERTVERAIASLEQRGVLILEKERKGRSNVYRVDLAKAPLKTPYRGRRSALQVEPSQPGGCDTVSHPPTEPNVAGGATNPVSGTGILSHPFHEPSGTVMEPSSRAPEPARVSTIRAEERSDRTDGSSALAPEAVAAVGSGKDYEEILADAAARPAAYWQAQRLKALAAELVRATPDGRIPELEWVSGQLEAKRAELGIVAGRDVVDEVAAKAWILEHERRGSRRTA